MILIERKIINDIPILEIVEEDKKQETTPLVFFYHDITNQKERGLEPGYALASNGMRVIIPDAYRHGERKEEAYAGEPAAEFWSVVLKNIKELPDIVEAYVGAMFIDADFDYGEVQRFFDTHMKSFFEDSRNIWS